MAMALSGLVVIPAPPAAGATTIQVMVVGDSISTPCTQTPQAGWCAALAGHLQAAGVDTTWAYDVHAGWSCGSLATDLASQVAAAQPDLVVLQCGTNDGTTAATVRARYNTLISTVRANSSAKILAGWVGYSDPEINRKAGRSWLVGDLGEGAAEGAANDGIYLSMMDNGVFNGTSQDISLYDLQRIPGNRTYLAGGTDGIHPNTLGQATMGAIFYRALRARFGLPDTVPEPCGMYGHRTIYDAPTFTQCGA